MLNPTQSVASFALVGSGVELTLVTGTSAAATHPSPSVAPTSSAVPPSQRRRWCRDVAAGSDGFSDAQTEVPGWWWRLAPVAPMTPQSSGYRSRLEPLR